MEASICKYCGSNMSYTKAVPPHVGLYCGDCGRFQNWVKQEQNIETGEIASSEMQGFAVSSYDRWRRSGKPLTKRQAGAIISAFKQN